jgi:hypothetical protein
LVSFVRFPAGEILQGILQAVFDGASSCCWYAIIEAFTCRNNALQEGIYKLKYVYGYLYNPTIDSLL